jgi:hypothetical protein
VVISGNPTQRRLRAQRDTRTIMVVKRLVPHPRQSSNNQRQNAELDTSARNDLRDLELEVEAEGREWMRRRLEQKIEAQVEERGAIPPPGTKAKPSIGVVVALNLRRGRDWAIVRVRQSAGENQTGCRALQKDLLP